MANQYFFEQSYDATYTLIAGEYEQCHFTGIDGREANLSGSVFIDCTFQHCDLSMCKLHATAFRNVTFVSCKMLGMKFENCNAFLLSFSFTDCYLDYSSFYQLKIKNSTFNDCRLHEVDFSEADLSNSDFSGSDLTGAIFDDSILTKSDFRTTLHFNINPTKNKINQAKFSSENVAGLLQHLDIVIS